MANDAKPSGRPNGQSEANGEIIELPDGEVPFLSGDLREDITRKLIVNGGAKRIEAKLKQDLDADGWTEMLRAYCDEQLRSGKVTTYNELSAKVHANIEANMRTDPPASVVEGEPNLRPSREAYDGGGQQVIKEVGQIIKLKKPHDFGASIDHDASNRHTQDRHAKAEESYVGYAGSVFPHASRGNTDIVVCKNDLGWQNMSSLPPAATSKNFDNDLIAHRSRHKNGQQHLRGPTKRAVTGIIEAATDNGVTQANNSAIKPGQTLEDEFKQAAHEASQSPAKARMTRSNVTKTTRRFQG